MTCVARMSRGRVDAIASERARNQKRNHPRPRLTETTRVDGVRTTGRRAADRRLAAAVRADDHRQRRLELDGLFSIWAEGADAADGEFFYLRHGRFGVRARRWLWFKLWLLPAYCGRRRLAAWYRRWCSATLSVQRNSPSQTGDQRRRAALIRLVPRMILASVRTTLAARIDARIDSLARTRKGLSGPSPGASQLIYYPRA